ncbi:hypothetical protein D3C87_1762940 [compost metagenome]
MITNSTREPPSTIISFDTLSVTERTGLLSRSSTTYFKMSGRVSGMLNLIMPMNRVSTIHFI